MAVENGRPRVAAIIPAAGRGVRMGGDRKQFRHMGGRPLLIQTVLLFDAHPRIDLIAVAVPAGDEASVESMFSRAQVSTDIRVVAGGERRSASVSAGLAVIDERIDVVLVHDAVRPFVTSQQIDAVVDAAWKDGGASLAIPVADTLRRGRGDLLDELVSREELYRIQTPQGFRRSVLQNALDNVDQESGPFTDDASVVIAAGHDVTIVPGSSLNFKLTTEEDWQMATLLWPAWEAHQRGAPR